MDRRDFNKYLILSLLSNTILSADEEKKIILNSDGNKSCPIDMKMIEKTFERKKKYYLTLDDGYFHKKDIINMANERNVKLNLFIIGKVIEQSPKIWIDAIEQGHLLGSHSYSHMAFSKHTYKEVKNDFISYENKMIKKIGYENFKNIEFFRFPYGDRGNNYNRNDIHKLITEDYRWKIVGWDLDLSFRHDVLFTEAYTLQEQINSYVIYNERTKKDKNIVLFHFKKPDNQCLEDFIEFGLKNECEFLRLDQ